MQQFKKPQGGGKYGKLEEEMERGNQDYIDQQRHEQQVRGEKEKEIC